MLRMETATEKLAVLAKTKLVPYAGAGQFWKGVRHIDLIDGVIQALGRVGFNSPGKVRFALARDGADLIASVPAQKKDDRGLLTPHIGVVASNAQRKSLHFYVGGMLDEVPFVVKAFGGKFKYPSWEYTHTFNLTEVCDEAVSLWHQDLPKAHDALEDLKETNVTNDRLRRFIVDWAHKGLITWPSAGHVWKHWIASEKKTAFTALSCLTMFPSGRPLDLFDTNLQMVKTLLGKVPVPA